MTAKGRFHDWRRSRNRAPPTGKPDRSVALSDRWVLSTHPVLGRGEAALPVSAHMAFCLKPSTTIHYHACKPVYSGPVRAGVL